MLGLGTSSEPATNSEPDEKMGLHTLPYDLLLNIASRLDLSDVHSLHLTCKSLYDFSITRPVYRQIATDLLRRCRALPLKGFQRLSDLSTEQLIRSVNKATRYEKAWRHRGPRPIRVGPDTDVNQRSNYMDVAKGTAPGPSRSQKWYKVVSAPPDEDVDWLSPITSSYTLCATKSGKVVCWDVQTDTCLAEWNPGERWELWKCRVEFEEKTVYFTMAKIVVGTYDDERIMDFVLMRLKFSDSPSGESAPTPPVFSHVTDFKTAGVVMNVFLLDPTARLLSAFVWVSTTNTIGLYALPDWDKPEYVFIDTGIECVASSNWSCILYERNIVIHCEESDGAYQYFYPLHLLQAFTKRLKSKNDIPLISYSVSPAKTLSRKFIFPSLTDTDTSPLEPEPEPGPEAVEVETWPLHEDRSDAAEASTSTPGAASPHTSSSSDAVVDVNGISTTGASPSPSLNGTDAASTSTSAAPTTPLPLPAPEDAEPQPQPPNPNPFPFPPWCPDSAHFVRQWWPSLPGIPRVSCTVVLLSAHDQETHRTRFVLAQHYFKVPLTSAGGGGEPVVPGDVRELQYRLVGAPHPLRRLETEEEEEAEEIQDGASSSGGGSGSSKAPSVQEQQEAREREREEAVRDDALMHLWYVSTPFEVVCVTDSGGGGGMDGDDADGDAGDRPRPLVAVDFGHAVWIEFVDNEDDPTRPRADELDAKWLRFVTFPPFGEDVDAANGGKRWAKSGGVVRTLEIPEELDLDSVETINIDQSQGAVILSVREGKIFILCYE